MCYLMLYNYGCIAKIIDHSYDFESVVFVYVKWYLLIFLYEMYGHLLEYNYGKCIWWKIESIINIVE